MEHLQEHPHAFIKNTYVINIAVFNEHDSNLLEVIKKSLEADEVVCCCDNGIAEVGYRWVDNCWIPNKPFDSWIWDDEFKAWISPVRKPDTDKIYSWDEENLQWIEFVLPEEKSAE